MEVPEIADRHLFGSLARGDQTGTSDVDILIMLRESFSEPVAQTRRSYPYFDLPVGVDLLVPHCVQAVRRWEARAPFIQRFWLEDVQI
jgi:predicted nucleotidyltransferase